MYKPQTLSRLIAEKNRTLFLPHIQRPFVWDKGQIVRFLDSLLKNYPIQTFLFWRTESEIKARKFMDDLSDDINLSSLYNNNISKSGQQKILVLDGQQRLQSLFVIYDGTLGGEAAYVNLLTGFEEREDGINYEIVFSTEEKTLPFFKIKDVSNIQDISSTIEDVIDRLDGNFSTNPEEKRKEQRLVRKTLTQIRAILTEERFFWIEELDGVANSDMFNYKAVLDVFIRINSGGTKLEASDLMFAVMKESWGDIEKNIEDVVNGLNSSGRLEFNKSFALKALMLAVDEGAELSPGLFSGSGGDQILRKLEGAWERANKAFQALRDFIDSDLGLCSGKVIRSYNSIIPLFEYLYFNPSPVPEDRQRMKAYYYCAQLFNWYSSGTDNILVGCHKILKENNTGLFPLSAIKEYFRGTHGKKTTFDSENLDPRLRYIILNLIYVEHHGRSPFKVSYLRNEPQIDHIIPRSKLAAYSTADVNHLGNYRFVSASDNNKKRAEGADSYFARMKDGGIDISRHLLVQRFCDDTSLLTPDNYMEFRNSRQTEMLAICRRAILETLQ